MGFAEVAKRRKAKEKKKGTASPSDYQSFVPSTRKELKEYSRKAKERDEAKKLARGVSRKDTDAADRLVEQRRLEARIRERNYTGQTLLLAQNLPVKNLRRERCIAIFAKIVREHAARWVADKKNSHRFAMKLPHYEMTGKVRLDDDNFAHEVMSAVTQFSWKELSRLLKAGLGKEVKTTDFIEAYRFVVTLMLQAIGAELNEKDMISFRLADRKTFFKLWPASPTVKPGVRKVSKEDYMVNLLAGRRKANDEDDEDEDEDDTDAEDEDEEEEEEEDEDEDDKPKRKVKSKKKTAKKKSKKEDEEEEDEDDEDDEDGEDDEDEDDEDEDEDDKPSKRKGKVKKPAAKKKAGKKTAAKPDKKTKGKKPAAGEVQTPREGSILAKALALYSQKEGYSAVKLAKELKLTEGRTLCPALRRKGYIVKALGDGIFKASKPKG